MMRMELLKTLAKKADLVKVAPNGQEYIDDIDGLEQFASLLVDQCITLIQGQQCNPNVPRNDRFFVGHDQAIIDCLTAVKMKFGVK